MSFDALTLAAVRDELEPLLTNARMQRVVLVDALTLAVEFFAPSLGRANVLLSAHLERARIHRVPELPRRGLEGDAPFSLLVRKHLRSARVRSLSQPRLERVFELDCEQRDASGRVYKVRLIVEAMGRRSNLVLVDDEGQILDAARRTPPSRNSRRPVLPHLPYSPPPPQDRLFPEQLSEEALAKDVGDQSVPLAKLLAGRVAGLSPLAARELAFRATGSVETPVSGVDWSHVGTVARGFVAVVDTHAWQPTVAFEADVPLEYAPYVLTHLEARPGVRLERLASISDAIQAYHAQQSAGGPARRGDVFAAERKALFVPLERASHSTSRRIAALEHQLASAGHERDRLRNAGEALLAHQSELPLGATELDLGDERIELDPQLSVVANAQTYFARYRKAREAEARVPELLEEARHTADYLAELRALVEVADQMDAIRALRREIAAATGSSAREDPRKAPKSTPYRRIPLDGGWEALVGTSAAGNATVTFDLARGDDLWLHARGTPGAHVILRGDASTTPPPQVIERGAQLAAAHSAARQANAVEVDVTPRRYVKKIPGGPPGLVRYSNERTLRVAPRAE